MGILLTAEAIKDIISNYWQEHGFYDGVDEVLCRAQVRKVVEWIKEHNSAPYGESRRVTVGQNDILLLYPNAQALKAAGEGK